VKVSKWSGGKVKWGIDLHLLHVAHDILNVRLASLPRQNVGHGLLPPAPDHLDVILARGGSVGILRLHKVGIAGLMGIVRHVDEMVVADGGNRKRMDVKFSRSLDRVRVDGGLLQRNGVRFEGITRTDGIRKLKSVVRII
jgi:hypothetical protein